MKIEFDDLIAKHLNGTLTDGERQLFAAMLRVPENQFYLATKIDEQFFDRSLTEIGEDGIGLQIFRNIRHSITNGQMPTEYGQAASNVVEMPWYRRRFTRFIAIAASVVLIAGIAVLFSTRNNSVKQPNVQNEGSVSAVLRHQINNTDKEKRIELTDGSLIVLAAKSEITYPEPFIKSRDISLTGKAYFKVAKDKTKPFIVTTGDISTTALGTQFTVTAFEHEHQIIVRLYEGKVVVKAIDKANKRMKNDVYLLPGQQFIYGDQTTAKLKPFKVTTAAPEQNLNEERATDNPLIPENVERPYFMFNNQQVGNVLDDLAAMYNVKILYNKQDVQKAYFTAKYYKSESLETILNRIATLNNLKITKKDSAYIISR